MHRCMQDSRNLARIFSCISVLQCIAVHDSTFRSSAAAWARQEIYAYIANFNNIILCGSVQLPERMVSGFTPPRGLHFEWEWGRGRKNELTQWAAFPSFFSPPYFTCGSHLLLTTLLGSADVNLSLRTLFPSSRMDIKDSLFWKPHALHAAVIGLRIQKLTN